METEEYAPVTDWFAVERRNAARLRGAVCKYCGLPMDEGCVKEATGPTVQDFQPVAHFDCYNRANPDTVWIA